MVWEDELSELALCMLGSHVWCTNRAKEKSEIYRVSTSENVASDMCAQRRLKSACAFAQSDQIFHRAHSG